MLFCIYQDDHFLCFLFAFSSIYMVYCINWFSDVKPTLHSWGKFHLVMVNDYFYVVGLVCYYLLKIFMSIFIRDIYMQCSLLISLYGFHIIE